MLRTVLFLSPCYVTLFWSIALLGNKKKHTNHQLLLSIFMFITGICFTSLFFYYAPFPAIYPYFDCVFQFSISLIFPVYYIYFRLLTVDEMFSFKIHCRYLIIPVILGAIYSVTALLAPWMEYKTWLIDSNAFPDSPYLQILSIMRIIIQIHFLIQLVLTIIGNHLLIHKYGIKVEQFYSDMEEKDYNNTKMLNYCIIIIAVSFITFAISCNFLLPNDTLLFTVLSISSVMLYLIGFFGIRQPPFIPAFDLVTNVDVINQLEIIPIDSRKKILNKMLVQFDERKIYLNSQLNIMDIVQAVGTNRTYISSIINQNFNQNFCSFVNSYRILELEKVILINPDYTNEILADSCGFGSLNSLKRAIFAKTGLTLLEWKKQYQITNKKSVESIKG